MITLLQQLEEVEMVKLDTINLKKNIESSIERYEDLKDVVISSIISASSFAEEDHNSGHKLTEINTILDELSLQRMRNNGDERNVLEQIGVILQSVEQNVIEILNLKKEVNYSFRGDMARNMSFYDEIGRAHV